jgi:Putative zinc-finger
VDNLKIFGSHPAQEELEEYVFGRLPEQSVADFEEHLLICARCQDRLKATDDYVQLMKHAAARWEPAVGAGVGRTVLRSPIVAILTACAITAIIAFAILLPRRGTPAPQTVELAAFRGSSPALAQTMAGAPLILLIDGADLDDAHGLRLEVVDSGGKAVWSGPAPQPSADGKMQARLGARLASGVYWVRLYSPGHELVREFGFRVL